MDVLASRTDKKSTELTTQGAVLIMRTGNKHKSSPLQCNTQQEHKPKADNPMGINIVDTNNMTAQKHVTEASQTIEILFN